MISALVARRRVAAVRLQRRGRLLVAVPRNKTPELTPETVEQTRSRLLDERSQGG